LFDSANIVAKESAEHGIVLLKSHYTLFDKESCDDEEHAWNSQQRVRFLCEEAKNSSSEASDHRGPHNAHWFGFQRYLCVLRFELIVLWNHYIGHLSFLLKSKFAFINMIFAPNV
jgi:hypothetical protein